MRAPVYILGINAYHGDSSACLVRDGQLVAAAEEERFRRIKHWAGFPAESIRYCLSAGGISLGQLGHVAVNQDGGANLGRKLRYLLKTRPDLGAVLSRAAHRGARGGVAADLAALFPGSVFSGRQHAVEHHVAHLSSAFHVSPFDEAAVVSVDGFGDFASAAWGIGRGADIDVDRRVFFPHSLGIFYQALTQFLGFPAYGDEYKVMGLAPYGHTAYLEAMRSIVRLQPDGSFQLDLAYFRHHREKVAFEWDGGIPSVGTLWSPELEALLGPARQSAGALEQRHKDIARSVQAMYEEAFFNILNALHARHPVASLVIAGGCGMNSVANGKVTLRTPFRDVYVQAAAGDAGGAIGAAFSAWHSLGGNRSFVMRHASWGPQASDDDIQRLVIARRADLDNAGCEVSHIADEDVLCRTTAEAIAAGAVVGWFQGRMEWGPRALGNRSIVCDPRRADMQQVLNTKIKRRESFRPFAPSILREAVSDWFEIDGDVPFMMQVYPIREERRAAIPAVTHVDGSGRLQTVERDANPRYYRLIEAFRVLTGVPMVLNTSFNENEPIVCRPEEALDCFLRTQMDVLVMGNHVIRRRA